MRLDFKIPMPMIKEATEVNNTNPRIAGGLWEVPDNRLNTTAARVTVPIMISTLPKKIIARWILFGIKVGTM